MSRFGDLVKGVATESASAVVETPAPEPVKEVLTEASPLEDVVVAVILSLFNLILKKYLKF